MYRSTKAVRDETEKAKLSGAGKNIINPNPKERLLNFQKRKKLRELLINKFMDKFGLKQPDQTLENEVTKFIQTEKLTDRDLQRLDAKLKAIFDHRRKQLELKTNLTNTLLDKNKKLNLNKSQPDLLPNIKEQNNTLQQSQDNNLPNLTNTINQNPPPKKLRPSASVEMIPRQRKIYRNPEEELAELEAEFAEEEKKKNKKRNFIRIDFSDVGDEWQALAKYNKKMYEQHIKEEREKDAEVKKRTKEDLDNQIKQKLKMIYEEKLKEKEGDKIFQEHLKKIDQIEKEKQEALKQQIMREKKNRDAQIRDEYVRKRIDQLKQRKFENNLIKNIQEEIEKEKQAAIQKKIKENEALKKVIRENEINKEKQRELLQKEKEEDIRAYEEMEKNEMKQDMERKRYFDNIRRFANKYDEDEVNKLLNKMKQEQKEEDEKVYKLMLEKNKREEEQELRARMKRNQEKQAIKRFLDMQIEEKKKEAELQKAINDEQARIWNADCKKYNEDEKRIDKIIKDMNKRNLDSIMEQIQKRKEQKKAQAMSRVEYAMNRDALEKAREEIDKNNA
jgi:hypothetical protein